MKAQGIYTIKITKLKISSQFVSPQTMGGVLNKKLSGDERGRAGL